MPLAVRLAEKGAASTKHPQDEIMFLTKAALYAGLAGDLQKILELA